MITFTKNVIFLKCLILTYFLFWIFENLSIEAMVYEKMEIKKKKKKLLQ